MLLHVYEERTEQIRDFWNHPDHPDQLAANDRFIQSANYLFDAVVAHFVGPGQQGQVPTLQNHYNGWLPQAQTSVHILPPKWGLDYEGDPKLPAGVNAGDYMYPLQVYGLVREMTRRVFGNNNGNIRVLGYRRRQHTNPRFQTDDRDVVLS